VKVTIMRSSTIKRLGILLVVVVAPLLHVAVPGAFWDAHPPRLPPA
jgi:hypothetical protein